MWTTAGNNSEGSSGGNAAYVFQDSLKMWLLSSWLNDITSFPTGLSFLLLTRSDDVHKQALAKHNWTFTGHRSSRAQRKAVLQSHSVELIEKSKRLCKIPFNATCLGDSHRSGRPYKAASLQTTKHISCKSWPPPRSASLSPFSGARRPCGGGHWGTGRESSYSQNIRGCLAFKRSFSVFSHPPSTKTRTTGGQNKEIIWVKGD